MNLLEGFTVKTNISNLPAQRTVLPPESTLAGRPLRALFVEDNADLRELIASILEEEGLDVVACASGEEAESAFTDNPFDLVVTDVSLPGMSGVQLVKRLLATAPSTWMVFSTGYPMGDSLGSFGSHVRCLPKPFETEELQALLEEVRTALYAVPDQF